MCGEPAAVDFIRELMYTTGEEVEVRLSHVVHSFMAVVLSLVSLSSLCPRFPPPSVTGPHLPAFDSIRCVGSRCGVAGQPQTRRLYRLLQ